MVDLKPDLEMVSFSSYNSLMYFLMCFEVFILCIYRQPETTSYLQVEGHLETLTRMKFYGSCHD